MSYLQTALKALTNVQKHYPDALIAGGFLRDMATERTPKDIDIFIPYQVLPVGFPLAPELSTDGLAEYCNGTDVACVWDLRGYELPVQVIMLQPYLDTVERVKNHDFGICQIWWHGQGVAEYTPEFIQDLRAKTFTLIHCEDNKEYRRSIRRWYRLSEKYEGWALVIPDEFQRFAADEFEDWSKSL